MSSGGALRPGLLPRAVFGTFEVRGWLWPAHFRKWRRPRDAALNCCTSPTRWPLGRFGAWSRRGWGGRAELGRQAWNANQSRGMTPPAFACRAWPGRRASPYIVQSCPGVRALGSQCGRLQLLLSCQTLPARPKRSYSRQTFFGEPRWVLSAPGQMTAAKETPEGRSGPCASLPRSETGRSFLRAPVATL